MIKYTGVKNVLENLGVNINQVYAGFSFYYDNTNKIPDSFNVTGAGTTSLNGLYVNIGIFSGIESLDFGGGLSFIFNVNKPIYSGWDPQYGTKLLRFNSADFPGNNYRTWILSHASINYDTYSNGIITGGEYIYYYLNGDFEPNEIATGQWITPGPTPEGSALPPSPSFVPIYNSSNIIYPDFWASNSATGVLNQNNNFDKYTGSGYFDGSTYMGLSGKDFTLNNSLIFISYQKERINDEILLSSFVGNSFQTYSGFTVGVNSANKLYLSYWNDVEGLFTFTYSKTLADKNLIAINKKGPIISIGKYNSNTFDFEMEDFNVFQNVFIEADNLYLGGSPYRNSFNQDSLNFSGIIDKFFFIKSNDIYFYKEPLAVGLYSNISNIGGGGEQYCFETGYFSGSGFLYSGTLDSYLSGYTITTTGITGYAFTSSGYSYSGVTGYQNVSLGFYVDNCNISHELFTQIPLSGLITIDQSYLQPLTGYIFTSGFEEIITSGIISGEDMVWLTGFYCTEDITSLPSNENIIDINYLPSLSYKQISLLRSVKSESSLEIITEPYKNKTLTYNKSLIYDQLNKNFFYFNIPIESQPFLFANGQLLIDNGYDIVLNGYGQDIIPKFDYYFSGNFIETNKNYEISDFLFYDEITGRFLGFKNTGSLINIPNDFSSYWIFKNGQKLIKDKDYYTNYGYNPTFKQEILSNDLNLFGGNLDINLDASIIIVGAQYDNDRTGSAYIYTGNKNTGWQFKQKLTGDGDGQDQFGSRVKTNEDGTIMMMAGLLDDNGGGLNAGGVLIYTGNKTNGWAFKQKLTGDSFADRFNHISLNNYGTILTFSSSNDDDGGINAGAVLIYTGNANNGWQLRQKVIGNINNASFGSSHAMNNDGSILVVNSPFNNEAGSEAGAVIIYTGNAINGWGVKQKILGSSGNRFGSYSNINTDASIIAIAAIQEKQQGIALGSVSIYTGNKTNGWAFKQKIFGDNPQSFGQFGRPGFNKDGSILTIGNIYDNNEDILYAGSLSIYTGNVINGWVFSKKLFGNLPYQSFGVSSKISNDNKILVVGGNGDISDINPVTGKIVIYEQNTGIIELINVSQNEQNAIVLKEHPNNFNYISGSFNSLTLINSFNHGTSQFYLNGVRQKININYIENAKFDLISGNFEENENLNIIYNNTDDFLT